jgi:Mg-chelatase subunit ChlD
MDQHLRKWRLILGSKSDASQEYQLEQEDQNMDDVLDALYDTDRKGDLGTSAPNVNRWLGDIRKYFPASVVQVMQKDALDRLGLKRLLLEPELLETIEMDVHLVATILNLQKVMPAKTRQTAREVVRKVLKELEEKLRNPLRQAIEGSLSRMVRNRRPKHNEIDWHQTIRRNLKHYQAEYKTIIPEQLIGYGKKGQALRDVILLLDQSGSMSSSVVYSSILAAVMASLRSLKTHLVAFDTAVVDLTEELHDPVELLFAVQLGGGTDINQAMAYAEKLVRNPTDTILVLISDLFEGGNEQELLRRIARVKASGVQLIVLLALSDKGAPAFDRNVASALAAMDIPAFACTPDQFPGLMAAAIQKEDIRGWMGREGIVGK